MKRVAPKIIAACALFYWATAIFVSAQPVNQATRQAVADAFYARPPFATGGQINLAIKEPAMPQGATPQMVQGLYLAHAGDCIGCHTRQGGAPFAGGLPLKTPFGTVVSTNITPDKNDGIGNYTEAQFIRLMRRGVTESGHNIYPAMPYASYSRLSDADLSALYAYFMKGVAPVVQTNEQTNLPWPFSMRWLIGAWNWLYLPVETYAPDALQTAEWNRGAYLVQGLGHCGACHTPRTLAGGEKATSEKGGEKFLAGAVIDGWYAQPLRTAEGAQSGLASWSKQDIIDYLKTGRTAHTAAFGAMSEVIGNSTQHLSLPDLTAMAVYLKSVGKVADGDNSTSPKAQWPASAPQAVPAAGNAARSSSPTAAALRDGQATQTGAMVYLNNCAGCHQSSGKGASRTFPSLVQSTTVAADDPTSLIRIVLQGSNMPRTQSAPSALAMPGLDWRLSNQNIGDVLTFIRSSWGNQASAVSAGEVAKIRKALAAP